MSQTPTNPEPVDQRVAAMERRIKELEEEVARARHDADAVLPHRHEPTFSDAGSVHPELTDDAIAPPG
ncbi:MAG: hypothetical protein NVSMB16_15010 [Acidimicrobiales bacterium]